MGALIKNKIDAKILHGRIEKFFYHFGKPVHLINKEDIPSFQMSEDADQISSFFEGRSRGSDEANLHLCGNDMSESRLSQSWRGMKENMIQRFSSFSGSLNRNLQSLDNLSLANIFGEFSGPQIEKILNFWRSPFLESRFSYLFGFLHLLFL
jgi:hypothetical protein